MKAETHQRVQEIKRSFRQMMDGAVAKSMRDKGLDYKLNWGAAIPRLQEMAGEIGKDYELAVELWKENVRECKILATMVMPSDAMIPELVDVWMEQTNSVEIAEQASYNLYQYLDDAPQRAYQWMASERSVCQLCGFLVLTRLFMKGQEPNERGINEFLDQALAALQGEDLPVRKAAMNSVLRFAELGLMYERLAKSALKSIHLDFL